MITGYTVPEIWCVSDVFVTFHFELFFTLSTLKCQKKLKNSSRYHHFTQVYQNS